MKITPDMVVAVPKENARRPWNGCVAYVHPEEDNELCYLLPSCGKVIYKLKPEYDPSTQIETLQARIAELEAELAKYKNQVPVAWQNSKAEECVASDIVKSIWLKARPAHVDYYTIPLYTNKFEE